MNRQQSRHSRLEGRSSISKNQQAAKSRLARCSKVNAEDMPTSLPHHVCQQSVLAWRQQQTMAADSAKFMKHRLPLPFAAKKFCSGTVGMIGCAACCLLWKLAWKDHTKTAPCQSHTGICCWNWRLHPRAMVHHAQPWGNEGPMGFPDACGYGANAASRSRLWARKVHGSSRSSKTEPAYPQDVCQGACIVIAGLIA